MAHKKSGGSSRNGRNSNPNYHGVKRQDGQKVLAGTIIVRQTGRKIVNGIGVGLGKDYTLFALTSGTVKFIRRKNRCVAVIAPEEASK